MSQEYYDTMQVCMNGHLITSALQENPAQGENFCSHCGAQTIRACPKCLREIRGVRYVSYPHPIAPEYMKRDEYPPHSTPKFCVHCGEPFPWTRRKMEALEELAAKEKSLSDEDRDSLRQNALLIAKDNPKSEVAALRIKEIIGKMREAAAPVFRKVAADLATDAAKKWLEL